MSQQVLVARRFGMVCYRAGFVPPGVLPKKPKPVRKCGKRARSRRAFNDRRRKLARRYAAVKKLLAAGIDVGVMRRAWNHTRQDFALSYFDAGVPFAEIGRALGVGGQCVAQFVRKAEKRRLFRIRCRIGWTPESVHSEILAEKMVTQ